MTSIDPAMENRFAEILAGTRTRSAEITERVEAVKQEIAAESQRMRERNERLCQELDERAAANAAAREDPAARNEWLKRAPKPDETFSFTEPADAVDEEAPPAAEAARPEPTPAPRRGRHRQDDFDDDDFSNNTWLG